MESPKRYYVIPVFLILMLLPGLIGLSQSSGSSSLKEKTKVPVILVAGTPYERGLQHGKQLKKEIAELYKAWKANIVTTTKRDADSLIAEFLGKTDFITAINKWTPGLMDEVRGISEGSGQPFNDVFTFQLLDEFWVYQDKVEKANSDHCSCIGVAATANHPAMVAQNMDLENYWHGYQLLLHISGTSTEPEQFILTTTGMIALTGMNEFGIGLNANTLMASQASDRGLPVAFFIRGVLSKRNSEEVLSFVKSAEHASGQNYIIGIQDSVYDFEASSNRVVRFYPDQTKSGLVFHTNHPLLNPDIKPWYQESQKEIFEGKAKNVNSVERYKALKSRLNKPIVDITEDIIKSALRSRDDKENPVCRAYNESAWAFTYSSVVYTLTGKRSVQVTYGPPDKSEYKVHFFKK